MNATFMRRFSITANISYTWEGILDLSCGLPPFGWVPGLRMRIADCEITDWNCAPCSMLCAYWILTTPPVVSGKAIEL
jgi:hypothetical protein